MATTYIVADRLMDLLEEVLKDVEDGVKVRFRNPTRDNRPEPKRQLPFITVDNIDIEPTDTQGLLSRVITFTLLAFTKQDGRTIKVTAELWDLIYDAIHRQPRKLAVEESDTFYISDLYIEQMLIDRPEINQEATGLLTITVQIDNKEVQWKSPTSI